MTAEVDEFHRRSVRLSGYGHSKPGAYFVSNVTAGKECLFGEILEQEVQLNDFGQMVSEEWQRTAEIRREIELGAYRLAQSFPWHCDNFAGCAERRLAPWAH